MPPPGFTPVEDQGLPAGFTRAQPVPQPTPIGETTFAQTGLPGLAKTFAKQGLEMAMAPGESLVTGARQLGTPGERLSGLGNMAKGVGKAAMLIGIPGVPRAVNAIPNAERAGEAFEEVARAVGKNPVDVSKFAEPAMRAAHLREVTGAARPAILQRAFGAIQPTTEPLTFADARLMQSAAGRRAAMQSMAPRVMSPEMNAQVAKLAKGLSEATGETAERGGVGPLYQGALKEYRQAKQIEDAKDALRSLALRGVKYGLPAGIGGAIGGTIAAKALGER